MKYFKWRDSATAWLRERGVPVDYYNVFITNLSRGARLDDKQVEKFLTDKANGNLWEAPKKGPYCYQVAFDMIKAGKTNDEVWEVIQPMFNLRDDQKYRPSWYRCEMRRLGEIPESTRIYDMRRVVRYE